MGEETGVHRVLWGSQRERRRWGDPDVDGRIILRWIFRKLEGVVGTFFFINAHLFSITSTLRNTDQQDTIA
jgi:hypothetical protein